MADTNASGPRCPRPTAAAVPEVAMPNHVTDTSGRSSVDPVLSSERESSDEPVRIELTESQVAKVLREALGAGSLSGLLRDLGEGRGAWLLHTSWMTVACRDRC